MGGGPDNPRETASIRRLACSEHNSGSPPVGGDLLRADMTSTPNSYAVESCFGFEMMQSKWPDCLPGFALSEQRPSDEAGQGMSTPAAGAMSANFLGNELFSNPSEAHPATGISRFTTQLTCFPNGAIVDPTAQLPNMAEKLLVEVNNFRCFLQTLICCPRILALQPLTFCLVHKP